MNRPKELDVLELIVKVVDRPADLANRLAETVAAVRRNENQAFRPIVTVQCLD